MEDKKAYMVFVCTLLGGVADIMAILIAIISGKPVVLFFATVLLLLLGVALYLYTELKKKKDFVDFVEHLFNNTVYKFTLLPKICLAFDKSKERCTLSAKSLQIKYTCDMSKVHLSGLDKDTEITYEDIVEYSFVVENKDIPEEFVCYLGNMYANDPVEISQRHGCQSEYELVPVLHNPDEERVASTVRRYSWQIKKKCITHDLEFPISFRMKYEGHGKAKAWSTFVFYPKQYAKRIDQVNFVVDFLCVKKVLQKVELIKVCKVDNEYKHIPIPGVILSGNTAQIALNPNATKYEVYYLKIYWDVS